MIRGDIYWARFPAPVGRRPVILVSRRAGFQASEDVASEGWPLAIQSVAEGP